MSEPEVLNRIIESCALRFRDVNCPGKGKMAKIAAAKFPADDAEWTVVECSLEPNGEVNCAMTCLLRAIEPER